MIVYKDKIFFHTPKCGGTFFRNLCNLNPECNAYRFWGLPSEEKDDLGHLHLGNYGEHVDARGKRLFTMLRNPVHRFLSSWGFLRLRQQITDASSLNAKEAALHEQLESPDVLADFLLENRDFLLDRCTPWICPQYLYCNDSVSLYLYDSEDDWSALAAEFDVPSAALSKLKIKTYEDVDSLLVDKVERLYSRDIALYEGLVKEKSV